MPSVQHAGFTIQCNDCFRQRSVRPMQHGRMYACTHATHTSVVEEATLRMHFHVVGILQP